MKSSICMFTQGNVFENVCKMSAILYWAECVTDPCFRVAFPKVDSKRVGVDQRSFEMHYRGLQRRAKPLPFPHGRHLIL